MNGFIKTTEKQIFSKVIWFVDEKDEIEITAKTGNRIDFIFVKTLDEFEKQINQNYYLFFSVEPLAKLG